MDGSCNNLRHPSSGQSNQPFVRLVPRRHSLINCGTGKHALPNPRLLSRAMVRRGEDWEGFVIPNLGVFLIYNV